jgi:hypothetical protein
VGLNKLLVRHREAIESLHMRAVRRDAGACSCYCCRCGACCLLLVLWLQGGGGEPVCAGPSSQGAVARCPICAEVPA